MKEIVIDCGTFSGPDQLHDVLAQELAFPQWYGRNWDALHDCLTAITETTRLTVRNLSCIGPKAAVFRQVLADAEEENLCLIVDVP